MISLSLPRIEMISLSHNNLSGIVPLSVFCSVFGFSSFSLKVVKLRFNKFTGIGEFEIGCLCSLRKLKLQGKLMFNI